MRVQALVVEDKASQAARNPFAVPLRLIPDVNMGAIKVRLLLSRVLLVMAPLTRAWVLCRAVQEVAEQASGGGGTSVASRRTFGLEAGTKVCGPCRVMKSMPPGSAAAAAPCVMHLSVSPLPLHRLATLGSLRDNGKNARSVR